MKIKTTTQRRIGRTGVLGLLLIGLTLVASGCSNVNTNSDQVGLHYKGGPFSSTSFSNCVASGTRNFDGPGDLHYYYPAGQRTFDFTGGKGSESDPITVVSSDNQELTISGGLTFNLDTTCNDADGGMLRKFHENIGLKFQPIMDEDGTTGDGWDNLLRFYMGQPLKKALSTEAQKYSWLALYNDPATRVKFEAAVNAELPTAVKATTGGNAYFLNFNLTLQQPTVNAQLSNGLLAVQVAITQRQAVEQQNLTVQAKLEQIKALTAVLGPYGYVLYDAMQTCLSSEKPPPGCPAFLAVPTGANINVPGPAASK